MKRIVRAAVPAFLCCALFLLCAAGCSGAPKETAEGTALSFEKVVLPKINADGGSEASLTLLGETYEEFYNLADEVVIADVIADDLPEIHEDTVLDNGRVFQGTSLTCFSELRVLASFKGSLAPGDTFLYTEMGTRENDISKFSLAGVPVLRKDMRVCCF